MTVLEIEAFLAVVQYGTLTKAADRLHISQPALSKRIAMLERELGYELVVRRKGIRYITLTDKGNAFISIANRWKKIWEDTKALERYQHRNTFHMAATDGPYLYLFADVLREFVKQYPDVNLHLDTLNYPDAYRKVDSGTVDIAFTGVNYYYKNVQAVPAYTEKMFFMCRKDADYKEEVGPEDLSVGYNIFSGYSADCYTWFRHWFGGKAPFVESDLVAQVEDFMTSYDKNLWTLVPASVAARFEKNPMLSYRRLRNGPPDRVVYSIQKIGSHSEYAEGFLSLLKKALQQVEGVTSLL